ncbi:MAG: hypothetical protein HY554_05320, partial [Elusimicrobia bacterium]|nr:hypothetical protein [Elusimicrobiota bacterium]
MLALWLCSPTGSAQEPGPGPSVRLEAELSRVRAERDDLDVRPARWDTRLRSPVIESMLSDPWLLPERSGAWGRELAAASGLAGVSALAAELLSLPTEAPRGALTSGSALAGLDPVLAAAVSELASAVARARPFLDLAASGLAPAERERLAASFRRQLTYGPAERLEPELFDLAARFDLAALFQAWRLLADALDRATLALGAAKAAGPPPRTLLVEGSTVTLGGPADDEYGEAELAASSILIDLGGRNRYHGPVAAAGPGEIKLVVDLGSELVIESSGSTASGVFGIGALALANPEGPKRLRAGAASLGAGLFGAGALLVRGSGSELESGDFSQGAAAFGLGLLDVEGGRPRLAATMHGQGFGFTRGVGVLRVKGDRAQLECGLEHPDPRDALAAISMCQGAGYGPRAFAAGGFGLARVESAGAEIDANYFAQGSGYWHGFGGFWFAGDGSRIQSRRYAKGAGVHVALGALEIVGDENRILNWGVGPAYGWDWGIGHAVIRGDRNEVFTDWGSGHGDVNGHAFARIEGDGNRLQLPELGTGILKRTAPSYALATLAGAGTRLRAAQVSSAAALGAGFQPSAWGAVAIEGQVILDPALALAAPDWRPMDAAREAAARSDRAWNEARLAEADRLPAPERLARWLFLAGHGGLDGRTPFEALARLLSLPDAEAALLPGLLAPERFDEFIVLRTILPAYGRKLAKPLASELARSTGLRKQLLLGFFRGLPAAEGSAQAAAAWRDADVRVRREAAGILASLFDRQLGEEPGRIAFLEQTLALCGRPDPAAPVPEEALQRLGRKFLSDLLAALALDPASTAEDRVALLSRA